MTEEKNINASKQTDKSQEQLADERLNYNELENVAGGVNGKILDYTNPYGTTGNSGFEIKSIIFNPSATTGK